MTTLGELEKRFELYAICIGCKRMERLDVPALVRRFGSAYSVMEVRARVRCRRCRRRTGDIRIAYASGGFHYRPNRPAK